MEKEEGRVAEGRRKGVQGTGDHSFTASTSLSSSPPLIPFATPRRQKSRHKVESGGSGPTRTMIILEVEGRYTTNMIHRDTQAGLGRGRTSCTPTTVF